MGKGEESKIGRSFQRAIASAVLESVSTKRARMEAHLKNLPKMVKGQSCHKCKEVISKEGKYPEEKELNGGRRFRMKWFHLGCSPGLRHSKIAGRLRAEVERKEEAEKKDSKRKIEETEKRIGDMDE
jgi:hypothetical protein